MVIEPKPSIRLCPYDLCTLFWQEGLLAIFENEHWQEKTLRSTLLTVPFKDYAGNTIVRTEELSWVDSRDDERGRFHRYITDLGTIGASGYPDPKRLLLESGELYRLTRPPNEQCQRCGQTGHAWPVGKPRPDGRTL